MADHNCKSAQGLSNRIWRTMWYCKNTPDARAAIQQKMQILACKSVLHYQVDSEVDFLGQQNDALIIDLAQGIEPDRLLACLGTVNGGGHVFWLIDSAEAPAVSARYSVHGFETHSRYRDYLHAAIRTHGLHLSVTHTPTISTAVAIDDLELRISTNSPLLLRVAGRRGRGKTTAIAEALNQLEPETLILSARQARFLEPLTRRLRVPYRFIGAQALAENKNPLKGLVVIDEAASIPAQWLLEIAQQQEQLILVGTDEGYEGSARQLALRFEKTFPQLETLRLNDAKRFANDDPLEAFGDQILWARQPCTRFCEGLTLVDNTALSTAQLAEVFNLLQRSHYATRPKDLRHLFDGGNLKIASYVAQGQLLGAALVAIEGEFTAELTEAIAEGRRRPRGHLSPQSLIRQGHHPSIGCARFWRVVRIAIAPSKQRQGLGSELLRFLLSSARNDQIDGLCASFAYDHQVLGFWLNAGFEFWSIGAKKSNESGQIALLMGIDLSSKTDYCAAYFRQRVEGYRKRLGHHFPKNLTLPAPLHEADFTTELQRFCRNQSTFFDAYSALLLCRLDTPMLRQLRRSNINDFLRQNGGLKPTTRALITEINAL